MIQTFKVRNCLSIRDEQTLNFVATGDDTCEDFAVVKKNNVRLLKLGLIYGANASGKSNIIFALGWLIRFMGGIYKESQDMHDPFLLDEDSRNRPTAMDLVFYIGDIRYEYALEIVNNIVLSEKLTRYPLGRPAVIFQRSWNDDTRSSEITFGSTLKLTAKQKYTLTGITKPNASVIATYILNNVDRNEVFDEVKMYLRRQILPMFARTSEVEVFANNLIKAFPSVKDFIIKILSQADFNISDVLIEEEKTEIPEDVWKEIQHLSDYFENAPQRIYTEDRLFFEHTALKHSERLPFGVESTGTGRMYGLAAYLFLLLKSQSVMLSDEIESSLHFDLLRYFVALFLMNSGESQMICSTHSLLLLDESFVRRDNIHICRKDSMGATEVVRASEFGLRKNTSILNAYREGKLGGIPRVGGLML